MFLFTGRPQKHDFDIPHGPFDETVQYFYRNYGLYSWSRVVCVLHEHDYFRVQFGIFVAFLSLLSLNYVFHSHKVPFRLLYLNSVSHGGIMQLYFFIALFYVINSLL